MKAAFKWRLQNGIYGYLIDEDNQNGPFAYDISDHSRIYPDGTIETGATVNEGEISTTVSKFSRDEYINAFSSFKTFINESYPQVSLLNVMYYYNIENDECTASASSLKCSTTDIIFDATAVEGSELSVVVTNEQTDPNTREALRYRLDFTFPNTTPSVVEYTAGDNIDITTGNTISALGYRYDQDKDSIAVGSGSVGLGMWSHAEGNGTQANGDASHAEGYSTQAIGTYSHAEGYQTESRGNFSHTEGRETLVQGTCGHAEGYKTTSKYIASHAEGQETTASANYSHAEGHGTQANGDASHAEGYSTQAIGTYSHAEGSGTKAIGQSSHAGGLGTITNNIGEHAEGKYNHSNSDTENTNNIGLNTIHSIGIGTGDNDRKNAFEVMENGDVYVYNVGDYYGTNATDSAKTLQEVLEELNNGGSGGSEITYVGGNNIEITDNTITAKGYTYNNDNDTETLEFSDNILSLGGGNATIHYDADEQQTTFGNTNGLNVTADGEMSISNTSDINVSTSEGDIKIVGGDNVAITAEGHSMDIITEGDMNITAKGQSMDITNTVGDINISSNNNMDIAVSNNFSVDSSSFSSTCPITAEVNGVENVYLGCPIGTIVMWAAQTAPNGWFLCNGDRILISGSIPIEQTIQGVDFQEGKLQSLVNILSGEFGAYTIINIHRTNEYIADATIDGDTITIKALNADINLAYKFYLNNETTYTIQDEQGTVFTDSEYTKYNVRELPNLQQKFPLGAMQGGTISTYSTNLGNIGGEATHELNLDEIPSHNHTINIPTGNVTVNTANASQKADDKEGYSSITVESEYSGGGQSHNNIPPFLAINFIIKYK